MRQINLGRLAYACLREQQQQLDSTRRLQLLVINRTYVSDDESLDTVDELQVQG